MKYLEFYEIEMNGKKHLLREQKEVYDYWKEENKQKYALYNGGTSVYEKEGFLDEVSKYELSESAENFINSVFENK